MFNIFRKNKRIKIRIDEINQEIEMINSELDKLVKLKNNSTFKLTKEQQENIYVSYWVSQGYMIEQAKSMLKLRDEIRNLKSDLEFKTYEKEAILGMCVDENHTVEIDKLSCKKRLLEIELGILEVKNEKKKTAK